MVRSKVWASHGNAKPMRPTKLNAKTVTTLCDALENNMHLASASRRAGIAPSTLHGWLHRGRAAERSHEPKPDDVPFLALLEAVREAQTNAATEAVEVVTITPGPWPTAAAGFCNGFSRWHTQ